MKTNTVFDGRIDVQTSQSFQVEATNDIASKP